MKYTQKILHDTIRDISGSFRAKQKLDQIQGRSRQLAIFHVDFREDLIEDTAIAWNVSDDVIKFDIQ